MSLTFILVHTFCFMLVSNQIYRRLVLKEVTAAYDVVCYLIVIVVQKFDVYNVFVFSLCPMGCCVSYHPTEP